jgi:SAM-dependent methyltransferase
VTLHLNYDEAYYTLKESEYDFAGRADRLKFLPYIHPDDRVLDFGCGGGAILSRLDCRDKLGIDPNSRSRHAAERLGIKAVASIDEVPDRWADVVITHHALEHAESPLEVVRALRRKIRQGGRIVAVVPCESVATQWDPNDPNRHLYTWSPSNLGNLFRVAGFRIERCESYYHRWPPKYVTVQKLLGWRMFHALAHINGRLFTKLSQTIVVGVPESDPSGAVADTMSFEGAVERIA